MEPTTQGGLTFGQKAVGLTFNPSGDVRVAAIKSAYANIIDQLHNMRSSDGSPNMSGDKARLISIAITEAQGAQMWAVKAITWE